MPELPGSDIKECPVPPITNPMGRHWDQPDANEIIFHEHHVRMRRMTWEALPEYLVSRPSGVYVGKMWRSRKHLHWYGPSDKPDEVLTHSMPAMVCDGIRREDGRVCAIDKSGSGGAGSGIYEHWIAPKCSIVDTLPHMEMTNAPVTCVLCLGR